MLILQYVLRWLLYLLTPFHAGALPVPGFAGIAVRFFQQVLAILALAVGFALTNLVSSRSGTTSVRRRAKSTWFPDALYSPLLDVIGGLVAAIMLVWG